MKHLPWWIGALVVVVVVARPGSGASSSDFDGLFRTFLESNGYQGGSAAIQTGAKMSYATGSGHTFQDIPIQADTLMPISSISKTITAVAVFKLIETGKLQLSSKVFGDDGVLHMLKPVTPGIIDHRLYDITVDHLLRHTAGWDSSKPPMFEPLINSILLKKGYTVPNITADIDAKGPLGPYHVIRYMMSQELDFTPGTRQVPSNLGYSILGRVIEETENILYETFVKKHILDPCGMWHTRVGPGHAQLKIWNLSTRKRETTNDAAGEPLAREYEVLHPTQLDSALGWYSNVYDMMRFMQCLDGSNGLKILSEPSLKQMLAKPEAAPVQHRETWFGAGFHVNTHGAVWVDGDMYSDDLILYHKGLFSGWPSSDNNENHTERPTSWVYLLDGQNHMQLRTLSKTMVSSVSSWPTRNAYFDDVSDLTMSSEKNTRIVKYTLTEHHLSAYVNAIKLLKYDVTWISAFSRDSETNFVILAEKRSKPVYDQYIIEHGLTEKKLHLQKLAMEESGFNLTFLQNYQSSSHDDSLVLLAIYRKHWYTNSTQIKFGVQHFTQTYRKLLELYVEKGYCAVVQSLQHVGTDGLISFLLKEDMQWKQKPDFKSYEDVGLRHLQRAVQTNAKARRKLTYVDSSNSFGKPRFSAVFTKMPMKRWIFNNAVAEEDLESLIKEKAKLNYVPSILHGYEYKGEVKYVIFLEKLSGSDV